MADRIGELPEAAANAWQAARTLALPPEFRSVSSVVITGMGGSAIGGDLVRALAESHSPVPVVVQRGYDLPAFAQAGALVIAMSHSGATEETLAVADEALKRGCKVLAVTGGGPLLPKVKAAGGTVYQFQYDAPPRAALGHLFVPLIAFFSQLGFLPDMSRDVDEALAVLRDLRSRLAPEEPESGNPAKQLARAIAGRLPIVYGGGIMAEVAHRWKTQFNENSKAWAAYDVLPELNHNAVVGYERPADFPEHSIVLLLDTTHQHSRVAVRERVTEGLLRMHNVTFQRIAPHGQGAPAQMLAAILLGDYVSYYLAQLYQVDPTPIAAIDHLKQELAKAAA
jgi:glucose/mannose-6-phosphate isomerase